MFAFLAPIGKFAARLFALTSLLWFAACGTVPLAGGGLGNTPNLEPGAPVRVALLVPSGSGNSSDDFLAQTLENAARLAISDLSGVAIDLVVYPTAGSPTQAAAAASTAVSEGAKIILGPLYAEQANAAGVAVAGTGVNLLAFSNNPTIAGGNVFILGPTFANTANRLVGYGSAQGLSRYYVVSSDDLQGAIGRDAIIGAVQRQGRTIVGQHSYPLSQSAIVAAAPRIASGAASGGADAIFMTAGVNSDLPILATLLPEAGLSPQQVRYIGLTRWDAAPQAYSLTGLQGGYFAIPDVATSNIFEGRYQAAYGSAPHPLAGLAYDGIAAIGALAARGNTQALNRSALTQPQGFQGTQGIFRLLSDGTNQRGLAVATFQNNQVTILDPAPRSFGGAGS